jgi:hypothetical protein
MDKIVSLNIAGWLACLWFTVGLLNGLMKLRHGVIGDPVKPSVPELNLTQQDLRDRVIQLEENVNAVRAQTSREREADRLSATARSAGIYKKIDETKESLTTKLEGLEHRVMEKHEKLTLLIVRGVRHLPTDSEFNS